MKQPFLLPLLILIFSLATHATDFSSNYYKFTIDEPSDKIKITQESKKLEEGLEILHLRFTSTEPISFPTISLTWKIPANDIQTVWTNGRMGGGLGPDWGGSLLTSRATTNAPVYCLLNNSNTNQLTVASSDALNQTTFFAGLREETAEIVNKITFGKDLFAKRSVYEVEILLDARKIPYWESLKAVSQWWERMPAYTPAQVPALARKPMYSTWYSFHQQLEPDALIKQCVSAKKIGCESIIIDDGWQTLNNNRGYAYCGDWKPERIPQMKEFVQNIHKTGLKAIFWYSVPYVGKYSSVYAQFKDKFLAVGKKDSSVGNLDPRYPEVRTYLINTYKKALIDWDLDGFKLDFVDNIILVKNDQWVNAINYSEEATNGRDYASVNEAVDRLMTDILKELKAIKPDIMIEFRQSYIGPLMRKYGNMFRVGDCPYDVLANRKSSVNLRLLSGNTAIHADPLMWHVDEPVDVAAEQILNTLFAVSQISVDLAKYPPSHLKMISFWLNFMRTHQATLQEGDFKPQHPDLNFPMVEANSASEKVVAVYLKDLSISLDAKNRKSKNYIVNGTKSKEMLVNFGLIPVKYTATLYNCLGEIVQKIPMSTKTGYQNFTVPASGLLEIVIQ